MVSQKTIYRTKLASAAALAGVSIGALLLRFAKPKDEPILHVEPGPHPVVLAESDCEPMKNDFRCEVRKGEADPLSSTFDPASCGYCGDGIRQILSASGTPPVFDLDSGIETQLVTERPSETPETCPVDFHCGNGTRDFRSVYGSWLELPGESGPGSIFRLGTKIITEGIRDCPADARQNGNGGGDAGSPELEEDAPAPIRQSSSMWDCPSFMAPSHQSDMVDMHSGSIISALSRIYGAINNNASELRLALRTTEDSKVRLTLRIRVEPQGYLYLNNISATCDGMPCGDVQTIVNATGLSLRGLVIGGPGTECFWTLTIHLPRRMNGHDAADTGMADAGVPSK